MELNSKNFPKYYNSVAERLYSVLIDDELTEEEKVALFDGMSTLLLKLATIAYNDEKKLEKVKDYVSICNEYLHGHNKDECLRLSGNLLNEIKINEV